MPSPFPGMDPYLEAHWGDVHTRLVLYAADMLQAQLPDDLVARVEEYLAVATEEASRPHGYYPDVRVAEAAGNGTASTAGGQGASAVAVADPVIVTWPTEPPTLHAIRILDRGNRVITAIEVLSPANKIGEDNRRTYRRKQHELVQAGVSLVEIDLLRDGAYVLLPPETHLPPDCRGPYRISVFRSWLSGQAEVYRVPLRRSLPPIRIPLRQSDKDVTLELQPVLNHCYDNGRYRKIDYRLDPVPPLQGDDAAWADALLREQGLR